MQELLKAYDLGDLSDEEYRRAGRTLDYLRRPENRAP